MKKGLRPKISLMVSSLAYSELSPLRAASEALWQLLARPSSFLSGTVLITQSKLAKIHTLTRRNGLRTRSFH